MKTINKLVSVLFLLVTFFVQAGPPSPAPTGNGTGNGGNGTGSPASPIDMYVYVLAIVAIAFIVFYTKKYKSIKA